MKQTIHPLRHVLVEAFNRPLKLSRGQVQLRHQFFQTFTGCHYRCLQPALSLIITVILHIKNEVHGITLVHQKAADAAVISVLIDKTLTLAVNKDAEG